MYFFSALSSNSRKFILSLFSAFIFFLFHVTRKKISKWIEFPRQSQRMRPIESNFNEKLKHDSFRSVVFFLCVFILPYTYNTCVNIFVLLKAPGEEGSVSFTDEKKYLSIQLNNRTKTTSNISLLCCFCLTFFQRLTAPESKSVEYACASLTWKLSDVSEYQTFHVSTRNWALRVC